MIPYPLELFQSTLSLRRATPGGWAGWVHGLISIHALLAESDGEPAGGGGHHGISIHALLAESDQAFLPLISSSRYFNPRSPCGERLRASRTYLDNIDFNPRSPCGERLRRPLGLGGLRYFNPRSPCGERLGSAAGKRPARYFNPRSPCGERLLHLG